MVYPILKIAWQFLMKLNMKINQTYDSSILVMGLYLR
jgi:hypothetical protein